MTNPLLTLFIGIIILAALILLFLPNGGFIKRWFNFRQMTTRVFIEDALKHIYKAEAEQHPATVQSIAGALSMSKDKISSLAEVMEQEGYVNAEHGEIRLTSKGRSYALQIIRAHRLWERYLAEESGYDEVEWHEKAHEFEHNLDKKELESLAYRLGNPLFDPHGDPIPTADGEMKEHEGKPLTDVELGVPVKIVHLENEPQAVFAQIIAEGLYPEMVIRVLEKSPTRIIFTANGEEHRLAPIVAANVEVVPLPMESLETNAPSSYTSLYHLPLGNKAIIKEISPRMRGAERRRFYDLGIIPGTTIETEMISPSGETKAFRVRGALIALRKEQAELIKVQPNFS